MTNIPQNDGKPSSPRDTTGEKSTAPFAPVPKSIMRRTDVSQTGKLLYGLILSLSMQTGYCYASDAYLAKESGVSVRQLQRAVTELESLKIIMLTGATNRRHITPSYDRNVISYLHEMSKNAEQLTTETAGVDELTTETTCQLTPIKK